MPVWAKIILIFAVAAYVGGGVGVWYQWLRAYEDSAETVDTIFVKIMLIGFIGLWVFFLLACWYVNRREEILKFIKHIAKKY